MIQYKILPEDFKVWDHDLGTLPVAFEMETDVFHEGGIIKWDGRLWHPSTANCANPPGPVNMVGIREHKDCAEVLTEEAEDLDYEDDITCPFCKAVESDSWENSESDDDFECGCCGGKFSYERSISVSYSMKPVQAPPVHEPQPRR